MKKALAILLVICSIFAGLAVGQGTVPSLDVAFQNVSAACASYRGTKQEHLALESSLQSIAAALNQYQLMIAPKEATP